MQSGSEATVGAETTSCQVRVLGFVGILSWILYPELSLGVESLTVTERKGRDFAYFDWGTQGGWRSKIKSKEQSQEQQPWNFREQIQRGRERVLLGWAHSEFSVKGGTASWTVRGHHFKIKQPHPCGTEFTANVRESQKNNSAWWLPHFKQHLKCQL